MPDEEFEVPQGDLPGPGGMTQTEAGGEAVLLVRDEAGLRAIGGVCPHAGAPLVDGVRHGGRFVCPWHKAAFCLETGGVLEPPAVDPVDAYAVRMDGERVFLRKRARAAAARSGPDGRVFVIAGAGAAGAVAAQTLREEGFGGRVVMVDEANRVPYDRTVLSKYALSGERGAEKSPLQAQSFYEEMRIERRRGRVSEVDAAARRLVCADGQVLEYDAALLATGSVAVPARLPGAALPEVFTLRSRADAAAILAQAEQSQRAVVIGAGFIGMEVAAALRERGLEVVVVTPDWWPFEPQLGGDVGRAFVALHERRGVRFRLRGRALAIVGAARVEGVVLEGGERLEADLVVMGLGARPATGYAAGLVQDAKGGLAVDSQLRVEEALFAAGDVARFPYRGEAIRVEHWRVAQQQGRVAALNMLGRGVAYTAVPYFWTIHFMKRLDYVGHADTWDEVVIHGDLEAADFIAYYVTMGVVTAAAGMGRDRDMAALIALLGMREDWRAEDLGAMPASLLAG